MTKSLPPYWSFLAQVEDARLRQLIVQVWRRLPAHDRAVLRELVLDVSDAGPIDSGQDFLALACAVEPRMIYNGNAGDTAKEVLYQVNLTPAKGIKFDPTCVFVIAHELAHVVLRHTMLSAVVGCVDGFKPPIYTDEEVASLKQWHEEAANLQAWAWGFDAEMRAYYAEYPEAPRPRWFFDVTTETPKE